MKIVIDMRIYGPEPGGPGRYNQKLLENLIKIDKHNQYILLLKNKPANLPHLPMNFSIKICNCHWYSWKEQFILPFVLKKLKPDLVHFTHFNVPLFYNKAFVVTIHDLIMTKFPSRKTSTLNKLFFVVKRLAYNITIKHAVRKSQNIIAISKFTAQDIIKYFKLDNKQTEKIKVIYNGVDFDIKQNNAKANLPSKYLLYVGNAYPHKNLYFLIKVFKEFIKRHPEYYLVLVGNKNYFYKKVEDYAHRIIGPKQEKIIFANFVPDNKLASYYHQATAYVFPSLYEGFGLPPLEAMHFDTPVLSSNQSCLPEILGEAALYFDPENKQDLLNKLEQIISDPELRNKLINTGQEQIKLYSWHKTAQEILEVYKNLV
jgi:glycosyltransferase involved in cell wall biosynthesis